MSYSDEEWLALSRYASDTGVEFDWFALDSRGHLAVFTTAGLGPVPAAIWANRENFCALEAAVNGLPSAHTFEKVFAGSGHYLEWCDLARKGLFAFDCHDIHRTTRLHCYDLIARPENPLLASQLLPQVDMRWLPVLQVEFTSCLQLSHSQINRTGPEGTALSPSPGTFEVRKDERK